MKQMVRLVCGLLGVGLQVVAGDLAAQTLHEAAVKGVEPTVIQQIVQQRVCTQSHALQASSPSAAGSLAGAVVGGAIGNAVSHGTGQAAATVLGAIAGAAVAQQSESKQVVAIPVENCVLQPVQASIQAFKVRFEWQGRDYEAILAHQPGQSITLQVSDVGANGSPTLTVLAPAPSVGTPPASTTVSQQTLASVQVPSNGYTFAYPYGYPAVVSYAPAYVYPYAPAFYPRVYFGWHGYYGGGRRWR